MLICTYIVGGKEIDITRYVDWKTVSITEQINIPAQLNFDAYNYDPGFPIPVQRAYVRIYSTRFNRSLFTGYISSQPNAVFQSLVAPGVQLFQYQMICTSDEHLLNIKAVPFIPAFVDQTQGQVLAQIADILCPGFFDLSGIGSGDIEPYFQYDPNSSWCELAKQFGDGSRYRYKVRDKKIWFQPYGDGPLGVSYDETQPDRTFDPTAQGLQTQVLAVPTVNDVTVIGAAEAGNNREDYFIGDGFTGNFPLRHKVFNGSSTLLLSDDWTEAAFNTQQWLVTDPGAQFNLGAGALNIVSSFSLPLGQAYIQMHNGLELAGGIDLEHGEFQFNDYSEGIVGGIYDESLDSNVPYASGDCLGGFFISSPSGVVTSASGAGGVVIQPTWMGVAVGAPVVTEVNHTYVLQTIVTAPKYTRYNRWYRSLGGNAYGGVETEVSGNITFVVQDYDIAAATGFYYQPNITKQSVAAIDLPAFAIYGLVNNQRLNVTISFTTLALMPLGALCAYEGPSGLWMPTGLILPMLPPGDGGYIGPVPPWPSSASGSIFHPPLPRSAAPHQEVLGNGFEMQAAQVTQGNEADTLAFYAQTLPAAGTPIRFQSWESQAAISRLQSSGSIVQEKFIVGDDGLRSAIVSNMNPLPRTSEDCDAAAQAFLADRTQIFYNGTYNCTSYFFSQLSSDEQFWPTCGRYLYVNSPARGIDRQWMLVTQLTIRVRDAVGTAQPTLTPRIGQVGEVLAFSIGFGADLHLEKVLYNFVDIQPANVLTPQDTAEPVNPLYDYQVDNAYQPDLSSIMVNPITDTEAQVSVYDAWPAGAVLEIRRVDGNWGQGVTPDFVQSVSTPDFTLIRQQFEQLWYMRFVNQSDGTYSRRSKVVRIYYPVTPLAPTLIAADTNFVQLDFNGDIRNVYGLEIRANGVPILQKPVTSYGDLTIDLTKTINTNPFSTNRTIDCYFFNHQWSYSPATAVELPAPVATIEEGYRFGQSLNVLCVLPTELVGTARVTRRDLIQQVWQVAGGPDFASGDIVIDQRTNFIGGLTCNVPASSDLFVRTALSDYIGSGDWSPSVSGLRIPLGDLISSDYLAAQGSVPPILTAASGALIFPESGSTRVVASAQSQGSGDPVSNTEYSPVISGWGSQPYGAGSTIKAIIDVVITLSNPTTGTTDGTVQFQISVDGGSTWTTWASYGASQSSLPVVVAIPGTGNLANVQLRIVAQASADANAGKTATAYVEADISNLIVVVNVGGTGSLVSYISTANAISVTASSFSLLFPNGSVNEVPESTGFYNVAKDTGSGLVPLTKYSFYFSIPSLAYPNPTTLIDGPYENASQSALTFATSDGRIPLSAGALLFQTASGSVTGNGAGGGTYGAYASGPYCGVLDSLIRLADGTEKPLREIKLGDCVDDGFGGSETVHGYRVVRGERILGLRAGKRATRAATGHTLRIEYGWASLPEMEEAWKQGVPVFVDTVEGMEPLEEVIEFPSEAVCHLELSGPRHTYVLDGFKTHNTLIKSL